MNDTWIKLYRKTLENGILKDHTAWVVFSWLLMMVDMKTGKRTFGRFQMSDELGIKPNTLYKTLHRLEKKYGVISIASQTKYTEVLIVNWGKYQHGEKAQSNDSQTTVKRQSNDSNTKQEYKNKELRNITIKATDVAGGPELKDINYYLGLFKALNPEYEKFFANKTERKAMAEMINKYGFDKMDNLLLQLPSIVTRPYAPSITSPFELQKGMGKLVQYLAKNEIKTQSKSAVFSEHD